MDKWRAQFTLSSAPDKVNRARRLISLAENGDDKDKETLLGCAILLLAIALEQAITSRLKLLNEYYKAPENAYPMNDSNKKITPKSVLGTNSLKFRLLKTPELNPDYPARINIRSDLVQFLLDLIVRRNNLMHFAEEPVTFEISTDSQDMTNSDSTEYSSSSSIEYTTLYEAEINPESQKLLLGDNPWKEISLAEARRSADAVEFYLDHVIGNPGPCEMLIPLQN
jgi:hypothetical protein